MYAHEHSRDVRQECRAILAASLVLVLWWFPQADAIADDFDFDGPPWHLALGAGPSFFPWALEEDGQSGFERQLVAAGYIVPFLGGVFDLALDYLVIDFLALGVEVSYHLYRGRTGYEIEPDVSLSESLTPVEKYGFHRLSGLLYAKATVRMDGIGANFEGSLQVAVGAGAVFWTMRSETEVGSEFTLRPGLMADWYWDRFCLGYRVVVPFVWIENLGPWELSHSPSVNLEVTMQTGVRW